MNIKGKRVTLRALDTQDLPLLHAWLNRPDICHGLGEIHFPSSYTQQLKWFERVQSDETTIRLGVLDTDGVLIGYTGFWNIHWRDRRAEHAVIVGDDRYRGLAFGREIIMTCARYAFEEMDLYRLDASILETNEASRRVYESCGYRLEGTLRAHALRGGRRVNRLLFGLLADEYRALVEADHYWSNNSKAGNEGTSDSAAAAGGGEDAAEAAGAEGERE